MRISASTIEIIQNLRDAVRSESGSVQDLLQTMTELPDFGEGVATAGFFVTRDGRIVNDHWWLMLPDGSCLDPTQDRFPEEEGFGDVCHMSKKDPRSKHYFPYTGEPGIPMDVLSFADKARARTRHDKNKKSFGEMIETYEEPHREPEAPKGWDDLDNVLEAFGGRPVGDPNRQSPDTIPDYVTAGGHEGIPVEDEDEEFKPEEFEQILQQMQLDHNGSPSEGGHVDEDETDLEEVDHPEFMPGGEENPRHDPDLELGRADQRQSNYNKGHPQP